MVRESGRSCRAATKGKTKNKNEPILHRETLEDKATRGKSKNERILHREAVEDVIKTEGPEGGSWARIAPQEARGTVILAVDAGSWLGLRHVLAECSGGRHFFSSQMMLKDLILKVLRPLTRVCAVRCVLVCPCCAP